MFNNDIAINHDIYEWSVQLCFLLRIHVIIDVCIDPEIVVLLICVFVLIVFLYLYLRILMMSTLVFSDIHCVVNVYCLSCWWCPLYCIFSVTSIVLHRLGLSISVSSCLCWHCVYCDISISLNQLLSCCLLLLIFIVLLMFIVFLDGDVHCTASSRWYPLRCVVLDYPSVFLLVSVGTASIVRSVFVRVVTEPVDPFLYYCDNYWLTLWS